MGSRGRSQINARAEVNQCKPKPLHSSMCESAIVFQCTAGLVQHCTSTVYCSSCAFNRDFADHPPADK